MSDSESEIYTAVNAATLLYMMLLRNNKKKVKKRRLWCRRWIQRREEGRGALYLLNNELLVEDPSSYTNFLRLNSDLFKTLLSLVEADISRQDTCMRESISARSRLQVTLRYLATGESFRSLMYLSRIHESTISRFIPEVCEAIYRRLKHTYLKVPRAEDEWCNLANLFYKMWDFPHCIGALDGRHIKFRAPRSSGSYYYNYKGDFSLVLLGLVDAEYKFTYVNVGVNGRISDGGVLRESSLWQALNDTCNTLNLPCAKPLPGCHQPVPYVVVADDAFPLSTRIMKPYPERGLTHDCRIFNYRLSRARRIVENAFGILANRFRVLLNPICLSPQKVELITLCCVALHNFLLTENKVQYCDVQPDAIARNQLPQVFVQRGNRNSVDARQIRDEFKLFFNTTGARAWQEALVAQNNM